MPVHATPVLDTLLAGHVITASHHAAARQKLASALFDVEPFNGLGEALLWLLKNNIATAGELASPELEGGSAKHSMDRSARTGTLGNRVDLQRRGATDQRAQMPAPTRVGVFSRSPWRWLGGGSMAILAMLWVALAPPGGPATCDAHAMRTTLRSMLFPTLAQPQDHCERPTDAFPAPSPTPAAVATPPAAPGKASGGDPVR